MSFQCSSVVFVQKLFLCTVIFVLQAGEKHPFNLTNNPSGRAANHADTPDTVHIFLPLHAHPPKIPARSTMQTAPNLTKSHGKCQNGAFLSTFYTAFAVFVI